MRNSIRLLIRSFSCNRRVLLLAVVWGAGLFLGSLLADSAGHSFLLLTRSTVSTPVSVVGLCTVSFLPFLLAAVAVFFRRPNYLYAVCFCKALFFGCSGCCVMAVFGSAGWLVRFLYQFSDLFLVPVLCWFALRHISVVRPLRKREVVILLVLAIAVCGVDYCLVSPFLAKLIN